MKMKDNRVVITRHGGPEVLKVVEDELPEPKSGEVRVKILVAGVSFGDTILRKIKMPGLKTPLLPYSPGADLVGVVEKLGDGVQSEKLGQMVAAYTKWGCYAEYICLPVTKLVSVPSGVDPAEAVCLVLNYTTAYHVLHRTAPGKARRANLNSRCGRGYRNGSPSTGQASEAGDVWNGNQWQI